MAAPTVTVPVTGTNPLYSSREGLEAAIDAALAENHDGYTAGDAAEAAARANAIAQEVTNRLAADDALAARIDKLTGGTRYAGGWSAASGAFPGGASRGDTYGVTTAGTVDGVSFDVGDQIVALKDAPSLATYAGSWERIATGTVSAALQALIDAVDDRVDGVESDLTPSRVLWYGAGPHVVDAAKGLPAVHHIDHNGTATIDVSGLALNRVYAITVADYANAIVDLDAGFGKTFAGTADRDGYAASRTARLRGGESALIVRVTGALTFMLAETWNPDTVRISGGIPIRAWEQPDGRYTLWRRGTITAGTFNADFTIAGKSIDLTDAAVSGIVIVEDSATLRDPIKVRTKGLSGSSGRLVLENPNAAAVIAEITVRDAVIGA